MVDTAAATRVERSRPSVVALAWTQIRYANKSFWRSPIAAFFTIVFPLIFLVLLSALIGNQVIDAGGRELRLSQFLAPRIAAFAATGASFMSLAVALSLDRDKGILKRIRGTPLPPWLFLVGRIGSAVWIALLSVALMIAVGVAFFGVQMVWQSLPAALLALALGIGCFAALALLVVAVSPSANATPAIVNGIVLPLAFISDVFGDASGLPDWLQTVGWVFPLKHFVHALQDAFNPFLAGAAPDWDHLAVMAAWGLAGGVAALLLFRWESPRRGGAKAPPVAAVDSPRARTLRPVAEPGRPSGPALVANQAGYATRKLFRNTASVFFVLAFPVILLVLLPVVFGGGELDFRGGIPLAQFLAPVLGVFGAAMAAYSDFSERVASDRDEGILKRLHGTPLPPWAYFTGRIASAVAVAFLSLLVVLVAGIVVHDVEVVWRALPGLAVTVVVGTGCFAALGLAIAAVAPDARATSAIAQATLLPLSFFSDIFLIGDLPAWMDTIGWVFPLKHFANAVADAFNPTVPGIGFFPDHLAVMALWLVAGAAAALRWWTWEPRTSGRARRRGRRASTPAAT